MNDPHLKRLGLVIGLIVVVLASALYLIARPVPTPPAAPAPAPSSPQAASTSSTQPKISWSQNQVEVILAPTESASSDLTFSSSFTLQNGVIEPVPGIAGLLSVQPNSFANVPAGSPNAVHLSFLIPISTTLGTYDGTIHLRVGSTTFPQTLKIVVEVWQRYSNAPFGMSFLMPPGKIAQPESDAQGSVIYIQDANEEFPDGITVRRHTRDLASVLSDITATLHVASQNQEVINGQTWTVYDFVDPTGGPEFLDAFTTVNGVVYQVGGKALSVSDVFPMFLTTISFE